MSSVTARRISSAHMDADGPVGLKCESQLRVAAAVLAHAHEITGTTVVGELRLDQWGQCDKLVAEIAVEYGLDATLRVEDGRFSVRFTRTVEAVEPVQTPGRASWLARLIPGLGTIRG